MCMCVCVYIYSLPVEPPSHPHHPSQPSWLSRSTRVGPLRYSAASHPHPSQPSWLSRSTRVGPCVIQQLPTICFTHGSVCRSVLLAQSVLPSPSPLGPQVHSLRLCLYFCPADRFTSTIFPNSMSSLPSPRIAPSSCSHGELLFLPPILSVPFCSKLIQE